MKPKFKIAAINQYIQSQINTYEDKVIEALKYAGEEFVVKARNKAPKSLVTKKPEDGSFNDRTGNLRASIGYVILKDGKVIESDFPGETATGVQNAKRAIDEVTKNHSDGLALIGVAGMSYAAAVESLGFDVITGSAPSSKSIKSLLKSIKINR